MNDIDKLLEETERLCSAATPGPWSTEVGCLITDDLFIWATDGIEHEQLTSDIFAEADARLIAHARTALPELVAEARRLQAELDDEDKLSAGLLHVGSLLGIESGEHFDGVEYRKQVADAVIALKRERDELEKRIEASQWVAAEELKKERARVAELEEHVRCADRDIAQAGKAMELYARQRDEARAELEAHKARTDQLATLLADAAVMGVGIDWTLEAAVNVACLRMKELEVLTARQNDLLADAYDKGCRTHEDEDDRESEHD